MNIMVTGVNGFVGRHLTRELNSRGHKVTGVGREEVPSPELSGLLSSYARCDLTSAGDVNALLLDGIGSIINLAGLANVGDSFKDPGKYNQINVAVLSVLGDRLAKEKSRARLLAISTGAVYDPNQSLPLGEDSSTTTAGSPYAMSKLLMEKAAAQLRQQGLECVVIRPFNDVGPGQEPGFLVPDLYEKIKKSLVSGLPVEVGNLKTKRDYTDVRDVVKAYAGLAQSGHLSHDLYNVCSSKSIAGEEILEHLLDLMLAKGKVEIKLNPELIRAGDPLELFGSYERLSQETGWAPKIALEQTLKDFVASKQ